MGCLKMVVPVSLQQAVFQVADVEVLLAADDLQFEVAVFVSSALFAV